MGIVANQRNSIKSISSFLLHKAGSMPAEQWEIAATEADQILNLTEFGRTFRKENVAYWQMWEEMEQLESKDLSKS